jgi:hypothetical protein
MQTAEYFSSEREVNQASLQRYKNVLRGNVDFEFIRVHGCDS